MNLASGMSAAEKQRKIADELRKRAMAAGPEGQMVSGHYVAPSAFQQLAPLANAAMAVYADKRATGAEQESAKNIEAAKQQWQSALPQAVSQQTQPFMAPGMDGEENIPGTSTITQQAQPLTTGRILKHTLAGMDIPGNEKAATLYNQGALADLGREDAQQAKREDRAAANLAAAERTQKELEYKRDALAQQMTIAGNNETLRRDLAAQADATQRALAAATDATRRAQIDAQKEIAGMRADAARDKAGAPKPVSTTVMKELGGLETQAINMEAMTSKFKPEYGGAGGYIDKLSGTWNPLSGKGSEAAANWWKDYENQAALVERHEKFGTALSAGEQAAWRTATIQPGMKAETIEHNLKERARIANDLFNRTRGAYIKGGHGGVESAFEERRGSPPAAAPGAPVKVKSIEEASKLPPGTVFLDPNGVQRVR